MDTADSKKIFRSEPLENLDRDAVKAMLKHLDFYNTDTHRMSQRYCNPAGKGFANQYEMQVDGQVIYDAASNLSWQQAGSASLKFEDALAYIAQLNAEKFLGFSDWRLPTLEEGMTLMEREEFNDDLHIDPLFDNTQKFIWTADTASETSAWGILFGVGACCPILKYDNNRFARAVRSGRSGKTIPPNPDLPRKVFRDKPRTNLSEAAVQKMMVRRDFYGQMREYQMASYGHPSGKGARSQYELQNNGQLVLDQTNNLLWQQSCSEDFLNYKAAAEYIEKLNRDGFAGFDDWRLPTLEETLSLLKNKPQGKDNVYIDPIFDQRADWIWTSDRHSLLRIWTVQFIDGYCGVFDERSAGYVRAVRLGEED